MGYYCYWSEVLWKWSSELTYSRCSAYLRLVPDEVHFRFGWFGWCRRRYVDLRCFLWFLDQDIDQSFLFIGWGECRNFGHGWWRWCGRLNEHYLIMFLWWRRGWQMLAWCVVRGFWRRYMHVYVLVYDGCLWWWAVFWWGGPVSTWYGSTSTRGSWVCVNSSESGTSKTASKSTAATDAFRPGGGNSREWCE